MSRRRRTVFLLGSALAIVAAALGALSLRPEPTAEVTVLNRTGGLISTVVVLCSRMGEDGWFQLDGSELREVRDRLAPERVVHVEAPQSRVQRIRVDYRDAEGETRSAFLAAGSPAAFRHIRIEGCRIVLLRDGHSVQYQTRPNILHAGVLVDWLRLRLSL